MKKFPEGFTDDAFNLSINELAEKYKRSIKSIYRWKDDLIKQSSYATSTLYDSEGNVKLTWIKKPDTQREDKLKESLMLLAKDLPKSLDVPTPRKVSDENITVYITNDVHIGMFVNGKDTYDRSWDLKTAEKTVSEAFDHLIEASGPTEYAIIADLGDLLDVDDFSNVTPKNKHPLTVDGRYPEILKTGYKIIINSIYKALAKHKNVIFISVAGNHDITSAIAINYIVKEHFSNNKRVIVIDEPNFDLKYYIFGKNIFGFTHGDKLKPANAGEVMALDCKEEFSKSNFRYMFFGHTHIDKVIDTPLCKCESFRNLAPLSNWASAMGYRAGAGKMVSITYNKEYGEVSRSTFNVMMKSFK